MSAICSIRIARFFPQIVSSRCFSTFPASSAEAKTAPLVEDEFRVLDLGATVKQDVRGKRKAGRKAPVLPPRANKMPVDQDWPSVWPVARTFHPASVPLPLHQGWVKPGQTPPGKYANAELMKIPNFLHLTPPAIQRQANALKKFCTEWPKELNTAEKIEQHFPLTITTSSYCNSSPSIRDVRARVVTLQVKVSSLDLDVHAKDKLLRLVQERYDPETDLLTLKADRCPMKHQNKDYAMYLLHVLVSESRKTEPWEHEKKEADMEKYVWEGSASEKSVQSLLQRLPSGTNIESGTIEEYSKAVTQMHNEGEAEDSLKQYKKAVEKLLGLSS